MADEPPKDTNRRAFARTAIRQPATVVHADVPLPVQTVDLGHGGMCFVAPRPIGPGTRCAVTLDLPLHDGPSTFTALLKVVYSSYVAAGQFKIGTVFTELGDEAAEMLSRYAASPLPDTSGRR